ELHIPMVYVSHSVPEIARLADTVVLLSEGRCLAVGNTEEVMRRAHLTLAADGDEIGSLIDTRVLEHDAVEQLTKLAFDGGTLIVPLLAEATGERVRVRIRPRDVSLALRMPAEISILNILSGRVTSIAGEDESTVDVELTIGSASLVARITRRSLREMGL